MHTNLFCVMGPTNAGKSTFLQYMRQYNPDRVGLVEVGKILRSRYPASYFEGQAAPTKTAEEAWMIMVSEIALYKAAGKSVIFIDGQPRAIEQVQRMLKYYCDSEDYECAFINLYAPEYIRRIRATKRDGHDSEKLSLSLARMAGDLPRLYEVISILMNNGQEVLTFDTSAQSYDLGDLAREFVGR